MIGDKLGRLAILELVDIKDQRQKRRYAKCQCSCGNQPILVRLDALFKPGNSSRKPTRSCGCLQREKVTKHGVQHHPLYRIWRAMIDRCYNTKNKRYAHYGGRGITVCEQWHDVHAFIADMSQNYHQELQINRIDNDRGYYKENCHWATRIEQSFNRSDTVRITYNGITRSMRQWAIHLGINYGTLTERIRVLGWPIEKAFNQPVRQGRYIRKT